ncbi:MAG: tRNA (N6-isopentenyl adenosine(37)-C2)-methylthiotransferase MiaB [Planctomycetaceae bacterium]|nr:tRNA (N6-isopentenyl adenosine(37)-C2)-methylthiotransferase MiaB [Planctomycetaceae bacterium]
MPQTFYIETLGCQMNVLDSELAASALKMMGMLQINTPDNADVILFNTCSVRQHAEDKVYSALGRLKNWKSEKPFGILGVLGCMAQKDQNQIFKRAPHVDFILGPGRLDILDETISRLITEKIKPAKTVCVSLNRTANSHLDVLDSFQQYNPARIVSRESAPPSSLVRIMFGCDQFCSYCIVPFVRGPEQSRSPLDILAEVQHLAKQGIAKITLIGQTVNSYRYQEGERSVRLADLLYRLSDVAGIEQIDFVTMYPTGRQHGPSGIDDDLFQAVRDLPNVLKHLHIPAQSGSDAVLQRMNRQYTAAFYREMADRIYATIPGATITSDFIVGFCGETDADFEQTVDLVKYCRFRNSFIFKYSERAGTKAAELYEDDVPDEVKKQRNNRLLAVQIEISNSITTQER